MCTCTEKPNPLGAADLVCRAVYIHMVVSKPNYRNAHPRKKKK